MPDTYKGKSTLALNECVKQLNSAKSELEQVKNTNIQCNKELNQMTDDYNDSQGSVEELKNTITDQKLEMGEKKHEIFQQKNIITDQKHEILKQKKSIEKLNRNLETQKKTIKVADAQNNKLQKEIDRVRKTREEYQEEYKRCEKAIIFQNAWPDRLELLLELLVWPYAAWNKKSILHAFLNKREEISYTSRIVLSVGISFLWLAMVFWLTSSLWRPYLYPLEENRSDSKSSSDLNSSSYKNTIKRPKLDLGSTLSINRGGAQVLVHPGDLAFLEIHAIKTKRKLDGQVFQYGTKNAKSKAKKIVQKIKNNRVVISVYTVATFYIAALADNKKIGIPNVGHTLSIPSQSLGNTRTTSIKETAIQGTKILLPGSDAILLVKKPIQESPKVSQTSATRFKNRNNVSKKRVGKLSDFSRKEFENSEIIENNIPQNFSKEGKIRVKAY